MGIKQIGVEEARKVMEASGEVVYVDVRTPQEFEEGHPPGAINIPVVFPNPELGQMEPNPEFMRVVEAHVGKDTPVVVGCKMGGRSQMAADLMNGAGYVDISNMQGGFGGARDRMSGEITAPGWIQMEFPVETEVNAQNGYEELKNSAL